MIPSFTSHLRRLASREHGSITPLAIMYAVIALATALVLFSAADLYLERKQLFTHADAAALAAANTFAIEEIEAESGVPAIQLDKKLAVNAAEEYLLVYAPAETKLVDATVDGDSVTIYIEGQWHAQAGGVFFPVTVPLSVEVSARALFQ